MRLEWWMHAPYRKGIPVEDEAEAFNLKRRKIFLVENEAERELTLALQYIHGCEVRVEIFTSNNRMDLWAYLDRFSRIYTSWDPFDANRY